MPLYEYECTNKVCKLFGELQSIICSIPKEDEPNEQKCYECNKLLKKLVSKTSFTVK